MDNFASLSDNEEMKNIKKLRADYNFRDRTRIKRDIAEQVRADTVPPVVPQRKPTLAGLVKEDIPYEDLPVPTEEELRADSGDENWMDNYASLSDSEEMEKIKNCELITDLETEPDKNERKKNESVLIDITLIHK